MTKPYIRTPFLNKLSLHILGLGLGMILSFFPSAGYVAAANDNDQDCANASEDARAKCSTTWSNSPANEAYKNCIKTAQENLDKCNNTVTEEEKNNKAIDEKLTALKRAVEACEKETEKAMEDCDIDKSEDMKGFFDLGKGMSMMNAVHRGRAQTAEQCGKFQELSSLATTGLSGFKIYCATGLKDCTQACTKAKNELKTYYETTQGASTTSQLYGDYNKKIKDHFKNCNKLTNNISQAAGFILMMIANNGQAAQCKEALTNANNERCKVSKELCDPSAAYDCNNPQVAMNNMVCKCRNNPNLPECKSADSGALAINKNSIPDGLGNIDMSGLGNTNTLPGSTDTPEQYGFPFDGKPSDGKANLSLGKGGGGGGGGGGGSDGSSGAQQQRGGGGSGMTAVLNGWNGGRGGAGGWGGGSGNGGWADNKNNKNNGAGKNPYMTLDKNGNPVDLRQFLPGQKLDATRGLAGISGPDGITGPNSSLWMKVRTRYNAQRNVIP